MKLSDPQTFDRAPQLQPCTQGRFQPSGVRAGLLFMAMILLQTEVSGAPVPQTESAGSTRVSRATDVVGAWQPHRHLYVKGELGVSRELLDGLEQWLDANATNWTVVLLENAADETFTDSAGQRFTGVEAVNYALGQGLPNQTAFSQQLDPRTGEPNGAIFFLALKDRKLSYFGSTAQDKRGLGEEDWIGRLDAPAIAAMRGGGRVLDAVKDTITHIDGQLATRIASEDQARRRQAAAAETARAQALEKGKAALASANAALVLAETTTAAFHRQYPDLTGDLARPDLDRLRSELRLAQNALERGETAQVPAQAGAVQARAETILRSLSQYPEDRTKLDELGSQLKSWAGHPQARAAESRLRAAREALEVAQGEYSRGDSSYPARLETARRLVQAAEADLAALALAALQRRWFLGVGAAAVVALFGLILLFLNRRRHTAKREAEALLESWRKGLEEKNSALVSLLDRRESLIGSSNKQAEDRYSGETLDLGKQVIKDVDELFIMSACAGRILADAERLLRPRSVWVRLGNLVQRRRYHRALRLLRDEPVAFRPEESLELVVRGPRTERDRLVGDLSSYQAFTMSFNELLEAFNLRASRAVAALDLVGSSLSEAGPALEKNQLELDRTRGEETAVKQASAEDGLFGLAPLFSELLPAAQTNLSTAANQALSDPVGAMRGPAALAKRQTSEGRALLDLILESRKKRLPRIGEHTGALAQAGLSTQWAAEQLQHLSEQADRLARQALKESVAPHIAALAQAWEQLETRAGQVLALDETRREQSQKEIAQATALVTEARRELGDALHLAPKDTLAESGLDPSDRLAGANDQILAARAALERGDAPAAGAALEAVKRLTAEVAEIVTATRRSLTEHPGAVAALQIETGRIEGLIPEHRRHLSAFKDRYAPSVLLLGAGDPVHPNANGTIEDNIAEAESHLGAARRQVAEAETAFREGRLLEAADLRRQVLGRQEAARFRLEEIAEKAKRLAETEQANARRLAELDTRVQPLEELAAAPSTMAPTQRLFQEGSALLLRTRAAIQSTPGDPFQAAMDLGMIEQVFREVEERGRCDRDVFEEAGRSLEAAATQLAQADQLARQSATDNIADSTTVQQADRQLQALATALRVAQQTSQQSHGDWNALDAEADRIANQAAGLAATLRGELAKAQAAIAMLSTAAAAVRLAGAWTGRYGVTILGSPGADLLAQARDFLQRGQYDEATRQADWARQKAARAVEAAEAEVRRHRRLEQERAERARREREARETARRSSWSSHSFGSGFGGRSSSFSSGSGFRSSGFSGGSGFKTSSW